jgi:hypothetical protein
MNKDAMPLFFIAAIFCVGVVFGLSREFGADFSTMFKAILWIGAVAVAVVVIFLIFKFDELSQVIVVFTWASIPLWFFACWPVIRSIAAGGRNPDDMPSFLMASLPWWVSGYVEWGIGLVLIGLAVWVSIKFFLKPRWE